MIFMKRASLNRTFRSLFLAAIAVSLLISGTIRPLLVQCTPDDGQMILEFIGSDPHRHGHAAYDCEISKSDRGDSFSFCAGVAGECVDLFLNHTAVLRIGAHHSLPRSLSGASGNLFALSDSRTLPALDVLTHPTLQLSSNSHFRKPLRI